MVTRERPDMSGDSELRQRQAKSASQSTAADVNRSDDKLHSTRQSDAASSGIGLDLFRALVGLLLVGAISSYVVNSGETYTWYILDPARRPWFLSPKQVQQYFKGPILLTNDELAAYDGSDPGSPIYLALNRTIYDVSTSPHIYGPGGPYSQLAAKDASRSYITTCFDPVEDLVPYFGGVEEVYVPLWLSRRTPKQLKPEYDAIATGEVAQGMDTEDMIENIKKRVGRKNIRKLQKEVYAEAFDMVKAQVQTWEGMFQKKNYPVVGRVVGVDEKDENKWRHLGFCEESRKKRPPMGDTVQRALTMAGRGQMGLNMGGKKVEAEEGKKEKKNKSKKSKKKQQDEATDTDSTDQAPVGDEPAGGWDNNEKAQANLADMLSGGKYAPKENQKRKIKEVEREGNARAKKVVEEVKEAKGEQGDTPPAEIPDAVPDEVVFD